MKHGLLLLFFLFAGAVQAQAQTQDYQLTAQQIAPDTYIFPGVDEDFTFKNGGNIVNTGFIITEVGVLVINSGPSKLYGEQMRAAISRITDQPIHQVLISKLHPDHYLGNQAFQDVPIATLAATIDGIKQQGEMFTDNMYRLVGQWMLGTELIIPDTVIAPGVQNIGGHDIELIALKGHTPADLIIFDHTTGVIFSGGVVFHNRAPTTPHASLDQWIEELDYLQTLDFKMIVPSHGIVAADDSPIRQTRDYVSWLKSTLKNAAESGLDMAEVLYLDIPERFREMAVMPVEFHRSVSHLYEQFEAQALPQVAGSSD